MENEALVLKAGDIVCTLISHGGLSASEIPKTLEEITRVMVRLSSEQPDERPAPPVPIEESYTDDYLICLEDGERIKLLSRYLKSHHQMTVEEYKEKWGLPADYPTVAANYSRYRSELARKNGLGKR